MKSKSKRTKLITLGIGLTLLTVLGVSLVMAQNLPAETTRLNIALNRLPIQTERTLAQAERALTGAERLIQRSARPGQQADDTDGDAAPPNQFTPPIDRWRDPHHGRFGEPHHRFLSAVDLLTIAADALGMSSDELQVALTDGQSIADLAAANDVDLQTIIDAYMAEAETALGTAVAEDILTQEQADQFLTQLPTILETRLNQVFGSRFNRFHDRSHGQRGWPGLAQPNLLAIVAAELEMDATDVATELRTGISIADLVAANEGDLAAIKAAFLTEVEAGLTTAITEEAITEETADAMLENITAALDARLTEPWSAGPGNADCPGHDNGFGGPRGHGRGGRGGPGSFGPGNAGGFGNAGSGNDA